MFQKYKGAPTYADTPSDADLDKYSYCRGIITFDTLPLE